MSNRAWSVAFDYGRRDFHERAFLRAGLVKWDAHWQTLSPATRAGFLDEVKIPPGDDPYGSPPPGSEVGRFSPAVLKELIEAGFVELRSGPGRPPVDRVFAAPAVRDFALRVRVLRRCHLLDPSQSDALKAYVENNYRVNELMQVMMGVLDRVGINEYLRIDRALDGYVRTYRWVDWVVLALGDPLAAPIVARVLEAGGPVSLAELIEKSAGADPPAVRATVDQLIARLVLFEDLDPATLELRLGLLPSVREQLIEARRPRPRPPLVVCAKLKDVGPDEGFLVADLRAIVLEVASAPARLRQDGTLFQKELERFDRVLESLPTWFSEPLKLTPAGRRLEGFQMARELKLVKDVKTGKARYLHLSPRGQEWLSDSSDDQYLEVFAFFRAPWKPADPTSNPHGYLSDYDSHGPLSRSDLRFLGVNVVSLEVKTKGTLPYLWDCKPKDFEPLRHALDAAFSALPPGVYHQSARFVEHAIFGAHNPLLLGRGAGTVKTAIYFEGRLIPPLDERLQDTAKALLSFFMETRLIPLGCLRLGIDKQGTILVARERRLDAYFGREMAPDALAAAGRSDSKVVVQPDYSVVIIGPSHAPAAELLPFCERTGPGSGRGALVLKITRESVLKAIARGLPPAQVLVRLKRHASHELPVNVVREVEGWTGWVRSVAVERLTVLRCPDRETADRVMGALYKLAERVNETIVAIPPDALTPVEHQKLLAQGIIVTGAPAGDRAGPKPKSKSKSGRNRSITISD